MIGGIIRTIKFLCSLTLEVTEAWIDVAFISAKLSFYATISIGGRLAQIYVFICKIGRFLGIPVPGEEFIHLLPDNLPEIINSSDEKCLELTIDLIEPTIRILKPAPFIFTTVVLVAPFVAFDVHVQMFVTDFLGRSLPNLILDAIYDRFFETAVSPTENLESLNAHYKSCFADKLDMYQTEDEVLKNHYKCRSEAFASLQPRK